MFQATLFGGIAARKVKTSKGPAPGQARLAFNFASATLSANRGDMSLTFIDNVLFSCKAAGLASLPSMSVLQSCWNEGLTVEATISRLAPAPVRTAWVGPLALPSPAAMLALPAPAPRKARRPKPAKASKADKREIIAKGPGGVLERKGGALVASFSGYQDKQALRKLGVHHMATAAYHSKGDWAERYRAEDEPRMVKLLTLMVGRKGQRKGNASRKQEVIPMSALGLD